jgi:hypothetical protein
MRKLLGAMLVLLGVASATAAPNDFEVMSSNVAAHPPGQKLAKGSKLTVPVGGKVILIDRTGGSISTKECTGTFDGPVEKCSAQGPATSPMTGGGTRGPAN